MKYLNTLYTAAADGYLAVWHRDNKQTQWFPAAELEDAADYMKLQAKKRDVYFGWGLQPHALGPNRRGKSEDVIGAPGFFMDIDLYSDEPGVHAKNDLPETVAQVVAFLEVIDFPMPTIVRNSGNGLYFDWLFDEIWMFKDDTERKRWESVSSRLQQVLRAAARQLHEWDLDPTADLARVTRMPGTLNHKTEPPKPVELLDLGSGERFTLDDLAGPIEKLEERFNLKSNRQQKARKNLQRGTKKGETNPDDKEPSFHSILAGCAWASDCVDNAASLPEPDWYALAGIAGRCEDGTAIFHEISSEDPRYSEEECNAKLEHALTAAGPRTCEGIESDLGCDSCAGCPFRGKISSPISLGNRSENHVRLMAENVFDVETESYVNLAKSLRWSISQYDSKHRHLLQKTKPHTLVSSDPYMRKVDRSMYLPGEMRRFVKRDGMDILNVWNEDGVETDPSGDPSIILEHLEYLIPDPEERDHLLNCAASFVQKPAEKITHVLLLIGDQGTGKTFLSILLGKLVGKRNAKTVNSDVLMGEWTASLLNCQLLTLEEVMTAGRPLVYNRMKQWVTDEEILANQKHVTLRMATTPRLVIGTSNLEQPVTLEPTDRRFWVSSSPARRKDPEYYSRLFSEGLNQAGAFKHFLMCRDISTFHPKGKPPTTSAKEEVIERSRPDVEQEAKALFEAGGGPFGYDLICFPDAKRELVRHVVNPSRLGNNSVTAALRALGAQQLGQKRIGNDGYRPRPWVLRNADKWMSASNAEIRKYFDEIRYGF